MTTALFIVGGTTIIIGAGTAVMSRSHKTSRFGTIFFVLGIVTIALGSLRSFLSM